MSCLTYKRTAEPVRRRVRGGDPGAHATGGGADRRRRRGRRGARTSPSASGARSARTTAPTATPGTIFTHDQARSRAYRWGEDGIAGICDERQRLCLALALWNGADPILKERIFGLTNSEGNHGEDAKEYWFYLDSTPTHSYLKCLYKYPQRAFPYADLVAENAPPRPPRLRVRAARHRDLRRRPLLRRRRRVRQGRAGRHPDAGDGAQPRAGRRRRCTCCRRCGFATRGTTDRRSRRSPTASPATPSSASGASRPTRRCSTARTRPARRRRSTTTWSTARRSTRPSGTKCAAHHVLEVPAGGSAEVRVRLSANADTPDFDAVLTARREEADEFYAKVIPPHARRRPGAGDAPGAGRPAVVQAVLRVRRPPLAARARRQPVGPERAERPQRAVVPHGRRRRDLDAGHVGVPVVRGLGPGLPLRAAVARRRRLRQGAGRAAAEGGLHAPQRADPGVRVELQRRQPAGHGVGRAVGLPARAGDPRRRATARS